jgi:hypothetical protein
MVGVADAEPAGPYSALPPCLVGMKACATAHYWAREFTKLGHEVRLMPAKDVKAYVKRNKNDAADASSGRLPYAYCSIFGARSRALLVGLGASCGRR